MLSMPEGSVRRKTSILVEPFLSSYASEHGRLTLDLPATVLPELLQTVSGQGQTNSGPVNQQTTGTETDMMPNLHSSVLRVEQPSAFPRTTASNPGATTSSAQRRGFDVH